MSDNVQIIEGLYAAFSQGDVPAVVSLMSPDIVWNEAEGFPYSDLNPYVGPQAVVDGLFTRLATEWEGWTVNVDQLLDAGDTVVMLGRYAAAHATTGRPIDAQAVHVWQLQDGKVVGFQQYTDTAQIQAAMGDAS